MANSREPWFPIVIQPKITPSDLTFVDFRTHETCDLPPWFHDWVDPARTEQNISHLWSLYGCHTIRQFTEALFARASVIGVLICRVETERESQTTWLVLQDKHLQSRRPCVQDVLSAAIGEYLYLGQPTLHVNDTMCEMNLVNRFFLTFGGLRDSPPHYGGDFFQKYPRPVYERMILAREIHQPEWLESKIIHTRGNCDYLLLSANDRVGYMPIENWRPIEPYADSFADAIMRWVREDRTTI
jgi:hypothetical protein